MRERGKALSGDVVFYQLNAKFVDNERSIPKEAEEVMYYTLAVGHHTGVIDCLSEKIRCSAETYLAVLECLHEYPEAHYKLEGIVRNGEIQIDKSHLGVLGHAIEAVLGSAADRQDAGHGAAAGVEAHAWLVAFSEALGILAREPRAYLMGRVTAP